MKIDAHQHFWHYNTTDFSWINAEMEVLKRDFLPKDLKTELEGLQFDGCIAVQARQTTDETRWLLQLANDNPFIKGVVGWVDLCSQNIEKQLVEFSKNSKLVGVRHVVHDEPDDNFMARPDFRNGISLLEKYNLTYDLLIFPKHLPLATDLVQSFPNQKFVLDHIAKPLIKTGIRQPWEKDMKEVAKNTNVYCKLSGLVTEADWENWKESDFEFYLDTIFSAFGPDRLMIGSDWPVCLVAGSYKKVMDLIIKFLEKNSQQLNKSNILGITCWKFYNLQESK